MRIEIEIPKEFEDDFIFDKFEDFFKRALCDMETGALCGKYEKEIAEMFIKAFAESKKPYDVEKVVKQLKEQSHCTSHSCENCDRCEMSIEESKAIEIVRKGGV